MSKEIIQTTIRLPNYLYEALQELSVRENTSLNALVRESIIEKLRREGILKEVKENV